MSEKNPKPDGVIPGTPEWGRWRNLVGAESQIPAAPRESPQVRQYLVEHPATAAQLREWDRDALDADPDAPRTLGNPWGTGRMWHGEGVRP